MPFTFSHPAASVPFARRGLVLSALVVGSVSPDFEYFLHAYGQDRALHTYPGVLLYTLPLSLLMLALFQEVLKWPVLSLLPRRWQCRMAGPARNFSWWPAERFLLILLSLAVGIATHVLWDGFTHEDGWVARHWAVWLIPVFRVGESSITVYKIAQYGSTVAGVLVLTAYFVHWYRNAPQQEQQLPLRLPARATIPFLVLLSLAALGGGWMSAMRNAHASRGLPFLRLFASGFVVTATMVTAVGLIAFSSIWWLVAGRTEASN